MTFDFDPTRLRLDEGLVTAGGQKRLLLSLPVRRPNKEVFVRVHPDPAYSLQTNVVELKRENETYLVDPALWAGLDGETTFGPRLLVTAVERDGTPFLWPLRLAGQDGDQDSWCRSALDAAALAAREWVRVQAKLPLEAYEVTVATGRMPDPDFPLMPFADMLRVAFKDRVIDRPDHPVLQRLRGEV